MASRCARCSRSSCEGCFIAGSIKRPGALRRLAKRYHALAPKDGKILISKLERHYPQFTTLQKQEFNFYKRVLRRGGA